MTAKLVRIGNSRGVRLPRHLLELYKMHEGDSLLLEETREGILIRPCRPDSKLTWNAAYAQMAAESEEWAEWETFAGDGISDDD